MAALPEALSPRAFFVPENLALILMETLPGRYTTRGIQPDVSFKGGREESCSALPGK